MIPLLETVTIAQAALAAAIGQILLTLYYLASLPLFPGAIVPSAVWAGFFLVVYRERSGLHGPISLRLAALITLVLGIGLQISFVVVPFATLFLTPFGVRKLSGWLILLGWAAFLIAFAWFPEHSRTRRLALLLAILLAPSALSGAYDAWNNGIGFVLNEMPRQALWRAVITPAVMSVSSLSRILFLWTTWGKPQVQDSIGASSSRLAP